MRLFYDIDAPDTLDVGGGTNPPKGTPTPPTRIPLPNYNDEKSRLQFAQNWTKTYGPLMQGRGDTPLRVNDIPQYGTTTSKQMSIEAAKGLGIDPALLYSSAMEEGMSGNFKNLKGEYQYERSGQSDKFPVNSSSDFGLDQVRDKIAMFQKKGYLPSDFQKHYTNAISHGKQFTNNDVDLDSPESAMKLKAAYLKYTYDDIDSYAKQRGIKLSPKARDFFALADYNGGEGTGHQMLNDYYNAGQLEGDKFLQARPTSGAGLKSTSYGPLFDKKGVQTDEGIYTHIMRRMAMRDALKKETLFDN